MRAILLAALLATGGAASPAVAFAATNPVPEAELREFQQSSAEMQQTLARVRRVIAENIQIDPSRVERARLKLLKLASDQNFLRAVGALWASPDRTTLLLAELAFAVFMFFFRAWRIARARNWFTKLLTGLFLTCVFWATVGFILPALILGEPFRTCLKILYDTLSA